MSEAYRRLRDGLPATSGGDAFAHDDGKRAQAWAAALPRANPQVCQQQLAGALDGLCARPLKGAQRLAVLDALRGPVLEVVVGLERGLIGSTLPLPLAKALSAQQAEAFHLALADGYRRAAVELCAPAGNVPLLRGAAVLQALQRATVHYAQALVLAWHFYREPAVGVWLGLHRVQRFAEMCALDGKPLDRAIDRQLADGSAGQAGLRGVYLQTLLVAASNPYACSQVEQDQLWQLCGEFAGGCTLRRLAATTLPAHAITVPEDADQGPSAHGEGDVLSLQIDAFVTAIAVAAEHAGPDEVDVMAASGKRVRVHSELVHRLRRAFGQVAARGHARLPAGHTLDTVIGMSGLHACLADGLDFDGFLQAAADASGERVDGGASRAASAGADGGHVSVVSATVLDQSLGGYHVTWSGDAKVRARVGELVGVCLPDADAEPGDPPEWMIGVLRWLRFETQHGVSAGIELLARHGRAVAIRALDARAMATLPQRAIEIRPLPTTEVAPREDGDGDVRCFLVDARTDLPVRGVEVLYLPSTTGLPEDERAAIESFARLETLVATGEYELLRPHAASAAPAGGAR